MRARIAAAWGAEPFDCYASTETSAIAFECEAHAGLHVLEGFVILEVHDGRVLVTNLLNKVQPMIRYELTDLVTLADGSCACGRASRRIAAIEGRTDDIIHLPGPDGREVPVHPNHFAEAIESIAGVRAYQVTETDEGIDVALVARGDEVGGAVRAAVERRLEALHVGETPMHVRRVDQIPRPDSASGKFKLVRARPSTRSEPSSRAPSRPVSASSSPGRSAA
jgi:phenylacetate-coenzyme A ligase PaaK-like adenylate-forming protein